MKSVPEVSTVTRLAVSHSIEEYHRQTDGTGIQSVGGSVFVSDNQKKTRTLYIYTIESGGQANILQRIMTTPTTKVPTRLRLLVVIYFLVAVVVVVFVHPVHTFSPTAWVGSVRSPPLRLRTTTTTTNVCSTRQLQQVPVMNHIQCCSLYQKFGMVQQQQQQQRTFPQRLLFSSFAADGSEYAAGDADFDADDEESSLLNNNNNNRDNTNDDHDEDNMVAPTIELQPPPLSKNAGNRFVAVIWDRLLSPQQKGTTSTTNNNKDDTVLDWHYNRIRCTEDHVMYCRQQNLYNTTFNNHSMVDILWSLPMYVVCIVFGLLGPLVNNVV
jgi:hypothetical protein